MPGKRRFCPTDIAIANLNRAEDLANGKPKYEPQPWEHLRNCKGNKPKTKTNHFFDSLGIDPNAM